MFCFSLKGVRGSIKAHSAQGSDSFYMVPQWRIGVASHSNKKEGNAPLTLASLSMVQVYFNTTTAWAYSIRQ